MMNYDWSFSCIDNGGKRQSFTVKAPDKQKAIDKAFKKAARSAKGDIASWDCRLILRSGF